MNLRSGRTTEPYFGKSWPLLRTVKHHSVKTNDPEQFESFVRQWIRRVNIFPSVFMNRLCYMVFTESFLKSGSVIQKKYLGVLKTVHKKFCDVPNKNKDFKKYLEKIDDFLRLLSKRRWAVLRASVKLLSLHSRAVVTANHPSRIDFSIKED